MTAAEQELAKLRDTLRAPEVRIEFRQTFSLSLGVIETAQVYGRQCVGKPWRKSGPLLIAPEDNPTRAGLLAQLAEFGGAE